YLALKGLEIMEIVGYPLSSYGFIVLIVALTKRIPKIVQFVLDSRIWKKIEELPLVGLLLKDTVIRMRFFLYFGTLMNLLYVILKIGGGILFHSLWLSFMGGYYLACGRV
ncbi:MAG: hypothetical protein K6E13_09985, partial [Lachnospiraceae bacterium]|nr:hypothetical protein [Lachnospiraceae bacterium]